MAMAQTLLGPDRLMFNHNRGLWGYSGTAADGAPLTIQATGVGGPSAAIVFEELIALGAKWAVRTGTCRALTADVQLGDLIAATEFVAADGASTVLSATPPTPTPDLANRLSADHRGVVLSTDVFYEPAESDRAGHWREAGVLAVDMESTALAAVAARHGIDFASVLLVTAHWTGDARLSGEALETGVKRLGESGYQAVADV